MRYELQWSNAHVRTVRQLTSKVRQIEIVPLSGAMAYSAGSHINVRVMVDGQPEPRSYSLVGQVAIDGAYRIAVQLQRNGRGGSQYMWRLAAGNSISISNPQNLFEFSFGRPHYLLLSGGIGITPLVGMAQCLMAIGASFQMLYCGRSFCEMAYLNELDQLLGSCLQLAIKDEGTRVDLHKVFQSLPADTEVYFCGPIHMLEAARSIWRDQNRPSERFRFETFGSSGQFPRESFNVHVHDLGRSVAVTENMTMLDALENAGIPIMSDCRRGECGLCLVDVVALEGQIDHRDVFLSDDQKQQGSKICTCVSRAVNGSITIDSGFRSSAAGISR